jgi:acyl-CoA synthetase (NDP forming)
VCSSDLGNGIGFSHFVCCGNEASIKLEDYLEYFSRDPNTGIILCYMEGLRDARRFFSLAREITPKKPIVVMKMGGTESSARASRSHTGALAGSDAVYSAAFRQAGVIRVESDEEMADVTIALLNQPLPRGDRVGILTMGGGLGVVATECLEKEGLKIADLEEKTLSALDAILPDRWSRSNPVDLVGSNVAHSNDIYETLWIMLEDRNIDALVSNAWLGKDDERRARMESVRSGAADDAKEVEKIREFRRRVMEYGLPFYMVGSPPQTADDVTAYALFHREGFAVYPQPYRMAKVLGHLNRYRKYLDGLD